MICNTCKHQDLCKEKMKSYGVEFVRISECKEYEMNNKVQVFEYVTKEKDGFIDWLKDRKRRKKK